jgi:hypothetical protein
MDTENRIFAPASREPSAARSQTPPLLLLVTSWARYSAGSCYTSQRHTYASSSGVSWFWQPALSPVIWRPSNIRSAYQLACCAIVGATQLFVLATAFSGTAVRPTPRRMTNAVPDASSTWVEREGDYCRTAGSTLFALPFCYSHWRGIVHLTTAKLQSAPAKTFDTVNSQP